MSENKFEVIYCTEDTLYEKTDFVRNCTLSFEKSTPRFPPFMSECVFGRQVCVIIPPHGDFSCCCKPCTIHRYVKNEEKNGWILTKIFDNDLNDTVGGEN